MAIHVDIEKKLGRFQLKAAFDAEDETLALLGASGCGKSMTLKCIAGVENADCGRIVLNGRTLFDSERHINLPPQQRKVGLMFQNYALFPQMSVRQNLLCGLAQSTPKSKRAGAVITALKKYDLEDVADHLPGQLSGGQQQRTALARMMLSGPEILMLDEPFSALDTHLRFRIEEEIRHAIEEFGGTVILVSHNRDEVYRLADRVAVLEAGQIERIASREEIFRNPGTVNACLLTGCKNISEIQRAEDGLIYAKEWGISLRCTPSEGTNAIGIRMHSILPGQGENAFRCRVVEVIENPFSVTVMLRPIQAPDHARAIGWEIEKRVWETMKAQELTIHFPAESIMQLKGEKHAEKC